MTCPHNNTDDPCAMCDTCFESYIWDDPNYVHPLFLGINWVDQEPKP